MLVGQAGIQEGSTAAGYPSSCPNAIIMLVSCRGFVSVVSAVEMWWGVVVRTKERSEAAQGGFIHVIRWMMMVLRRSLHAEYWYKFDRPRGQQDVVSKYAFAKMQYRFAPGLGAARNNQLQAQVFKVPAHRIVAV